ncbi:hypothetical protein F4678DRAFT_7661 [Xylaria arbuscula]|nr:hypothetical protein F4678DRAFT_7661 [Xylaria arbuscula]
MARIEVEYPSRYICDGGESVYFSTSHHEVTEPAMFTTARATLDRLQPDLEPIMGRLGRKAKASSSSQVNLVTVELRMAGVVEAGGTTVTLRPSVWITCRDKSTCKAVRHRLDQLVWLNSSHYSPVYVRSVLRLASTERYTVLRELDFSHGTPFWMDTPEGQIRRDVHIHVERSGKSASHGLLSCITITRSGDDTVLYQEFCRIGGHIIINQHTRPQHVAVTTGHGLLEYWIQEEMNYVGNSPEPGEAEAEATVLEDIYSDDYTEPDERTKLTDRPIDTEINLVTNWEPALLFPDNINFVSQASPTMGGFFEIRTNSISIDTDFLLLSATTRRDSGAPMMANAMEEVSVNSYMSDETMSSSKIAGTIVSVKSGEPQTAEILPDTIPFFVNGVVLQTKKVQLSKPT